MTAFWTVVVSVSVFLSRERGFSVHTVSDRGRAGERQCALPRTSLVPTSTSVHHEMSRARSLGSLRANLPPSLVTMWDSNDSGAVSLIGYAVSGLTLRRGKLPFTLVRKASSLMVSSQRMRLHPSSQVTGRHC